MANSPDDDENTRAIEKLRSWKEISKSAEQTVDPTPDDYATELELFEQGEIDKALWAKHLVEMRGNEEEAKWSYIKERVTTAPARRAEEAERRRKAEEEQKAEKARREAAEAEIKRKAAEAERKRKAAEAEKKRKAAEKARQERLKLLGEERERQRERAEEEARKRAEEAARRKAESEWEQIKSREHASKSSGVGPSPDVVFPLPEAPDATKGNGNHSVSTSVRSTLFLLLLLISVPFFLINIFSGSSTEVDPNLGQTSEERAYELIMRSEEQFYGATGVVDEVAAKATILSALQGIENIDSDYANRIREFGKSWLVNVLACASNPTVRDPKGAEGLKRKITDLSVGNIKAKFFWDVYWGEAFPQGSLDKTAYQEWKNKVNQEMARLDLGEKSERERINALEIWAATDTTSAYELAQFYECRTQNQDFELASDWYVRALENAKKTQDSADPVDEDTVKMIRSRLERLRKVISATFLQ